MGSIIEVAVGSIAGVVAVGGGGIVAVGALVGVAESPPQAIATTATVATIIARNILVMAE